MRIRTKLLLFFFLVAIAPVVVVAFYTRAQIGVLGEELATVSRTRLIESARSDLNEDLRHVTEMIQLRRRTAEMLVFSQAREIEKLMGAPPSGEPAVYSNEGLRSPGSAYRGSGAQRQPRPPQPQRDDAADHGQRGSRRLPPTDRQNAFVAG